MVTTTRVLSYAKAQDLVLTLKKFLSSRGDILADVRSNTLIIRDIPSVLPVMDNLLRQLDRKSQQVEIEARVVAANRSFTRDIGTQFAAAVSAGGGQSILGGASTVGTSPIVRNSPTPLPPIIVGSGASAPTSGSMPLITNLGATTPTSALSYAFSSSNFALDFIISAAEERGIGKLISKPKLITQNNQKATVKQGTKIPVQTIVNNTVSVQFVDAVLELDVTPQITSEGTIFMDVTVTNDQIDQAIPRVQGIPAIDTQEANTKVLIADGGTVVIGGIIVSSQNTTVDQVPLFGSIPVVGNLFKHTNVQIEFPGTLVLPDAAYFAKLSNGRAHAGTAAKVRPKPVQVNSGRSRIDRLRLSFSKLRVDAFLVTHLPNVQYLCGFSGSAGALLVETFALHANY